jgi:hypothetical protein
VNVPTDDFPEDDIDSDITGPSSEPKEPIVTLGPISAPTVRTGGQGGVAWILMEVVEAYNVYDFTDRQWAITLLGGTVFFSWLQNTIEKARGRRLVGTDG